MESPSTGPAAPSAPPGAPRAEGAAPPPVKLPVAPARADLLEGRPAYLLALSLGLILVVNAFVITVVPVVRPELQEAPFLFSSSQIGLLTSIFMLSYCIVGIPMGLAAARWGGRTVAVSIGIMVAGLVIFAFSSSFGWFMTGRFLQGCGAACCAPVATALIAHNIAPSLRNRALGIYGSGIGVGTIFALLMLPSIQEAGGYRVTFVSLAGVAVVIGAAVVSNRTVRRLPAHNREDTSLLKLIAALGRLALNRRMWLMVTINTAQAAVSIALVVWTPPFLQDQRSASLGVAAALTAGVGAAQFLGNQAGAGVMSRWGKPLTLLVSLALLAVFTAVVPLSPGMVGVFVLVMVAMFLTLMGFSPVLASIPEIVERPEDIGPAVGFLGLTSLVGLVLAPWVFGAILDTLGRAPGRPGYLWGYLVLALFPLVGAAAAVVYWLSGRRSAGAGSDEPREVL